MRLSPPGAKTDAAADATLRAAVYADPASDAPRAVYADWLQERGDPRGEFIALQLKGGAANERRAAKLVAKHRLAWLGSLARFAGDRDAEVWKRGFPSRLAVTPPARGKLPIDPAWATLDEVMEELPAVAGNAMPVLASAWEQDPAVLAGLVALADRPPLALLDIDDVASPPAALRRAHAALTALRLPALVELRLHIAAWSARAVLEPAMLGELLAIGPLERLTISAPLATLDAWVAATAPTALEKFSLRFEGGGTVEWWPDQRRLDVDKLGTEAAIVTLAGVVERFPVGTLKILQVRSVSKGAWTLAARRRMTAVHVPHTAHTSWSLAYYTPPPRGRST